jgi:hypothetical protein
MMMLHLLAVLNHNLTLNYLIYEFSCKYFNEEKPKVIYLFIIESLPMALFLLKTSFERYTFYYCCFIRVYRRLYHSYQKSKDIIRVQIYNKQTTKKFKLMKITNGKVLSNFVIYRYVEIALIILGIVLMYSSMNDTFWRV